MNIKQAKIEIKRTIKAYLAKDDTGKYRIPAIRQRPILLMGPPGIGKTQIMEQIARECKIGLVAYTITHHTRQSAVGLPFIKEEIYGGKSYSVTEYTMSEIIASIYQKMQSSKLTEGILFIDEINCVSETLTPTMLQFLQCKTFGNQAVPEGWIIIAAGNPPQYNKSVRDFDMVTLDRVRYMELEADFAAWKEYARTVHIHRAILSYLEIRPENFYRVEADVDGLQFITARGWEDLSNLMDVYEEFGFPIDENVVREFLNQKDAATEAAAYFDLYRKYKDDYGISEILAGRVKPQVYARLSGAAFDERLSVVNLLSDALSHFFMRVAQETKRADMWYAFLKDYRDQLTDSREPAICYTRLMKRQEEVFAQKCLGNQLDKKQQQTYEWLFMQLKKYAPGNGQSPQEAFAYTKEGFELQQEKLEQAELAAGVALEYAFDFMEQAFAGQQEMVLFVTDLAISAESAAYLAEHPCERFVKYNEQLLIGTRREQLLSEISRDFEQFT